MNLKKIGLNEKNYKIKKCIYDMIIYSNRNMKKHFKKTCGYQEFIFLSYSA